MSTSWITSTELESYLDGLGVSTIPGGITLADEIQAAADEWEAATGYLPFIVEGSDSTIRLSPGCSSLLDLRTGYVSITSVSVGAGPSDTGTAITLGTEYWLRPQGAASDSKPYNFIQFAYYGGGEENSIIVVGKRGYAATIPAMAWNAVRDRAAASVVRASLGYAGSVQKEKKGPVEITYGTTANGFVETTASNWDRAVQRFFRVRM